uniref:acetyl-CoA carboxylase carboxyltransferase betasubunit n=1 Tax=Tanaecium tetramerum TaxID=1971366 RepID=UPI0028D7209A|nr:acetyl-CoA carboxylase carboxyltransferase betasubunit [Tanaecium tetramerum]WMU99880.1 acetyl-CoA carboxylase carboxyltransferase betasubunit [Tanaecium tetramerum]
MLLGVLNSKCYFGLNCCFSSNWSFNPILFKTQSSWGDGIKSSWKACGESGEDRFVNGAPFGGQNGNGAPFGGQNGNGAPFGGQNGNGAPFGGQNGNGAPFGGQNGNGAPFGGQNGNDHSGNGNGAPFDEKGGTCGQSGRSDTPNPAKGNDLRIREDSKNPKPKDPESNDSDDTNADDPNQIHPDDSDPKHSYPRCTPPHIAALWVLCEDCYQLNYKRLLKERNNMCEHCEYHFKMNSSERIEFLSDPGTWHPIDEDMASPDPDPSESDSKKVSKNPSEYEFSLKDLEEEISLIRKAIQKISERFSESDSEEVSERSSESDSEEVSERSSESDSEEVSERSSESDSEEVSKDPSESDSEEVSKDPSESDSEEVSKDPSESDSEEVSKDPSESDSEEEDKPYEDRLDSYRKKTGLNEAVQTGVGQINGIPVAFGIMEFEFMGGSMGSVVGEKIARLVEYAINQSLPLIIVCASGGARMQEGSVSLMQMAKISCALLDYDECNSKLVYISILASPTTGGVTASFGTLADIIFAEPNSYIAFAGKRVIEETLKQPIPEGSQEAEPLFEKGIFDLIIPRKLLKQVLTEFLQFHGFNPLNSNSIK